MMKDFLENIRATLAPLNRKILNHPYLSEAEKGALPLGKVKNFIANQYYIINQDVRSLALMASRSRSWAEFEFFNTILKADEEARPMLIKMAEAIGMDIPNLKNYEPIPEAIVYAHYLIALAHHSHSGEQAIALVVNLPVWGSNCRRLSTALREQYGVNETSFLDLFAQPTTELEEQALSIIGRYTREEKRLRRVARLIQAYELMFWEGIYKLES